MEQVILIESEGIIERVRYMMERMDLNATTFATEAGITPSVISHMLNGRNRPTIETLNNIISAYPDWSYEWLLFGKGAPKKQENETIVATSPVETSLFATSSATSKSTSQPNHGIIGAAPSASLGQQQVVSFPFSSEEVTQFRQILQDKQAEPRAVSEIRIFYNDGSYEIFTPKESGKK